MLKQAIKRAASGRLGWSLSAPLRSGGVVVLMYHRITRGDDPFPGTSRDRFALQMRWLKSRCAVISAHEFSEEVRRKDRRRTRVLVTFDDGYRDYHDNAYPVLADLAMPAVVFLATSFMGTDRLIWTEAVSWAFRQSARRDVALPWEPGKTLVLAGLDSRARAANDAKEHLKGLPDMERRHAQEELFRALETDPESGSAGRQMLSWGEVRATLELTTYGGHTHTHPILSRLPPEEADAEIRTCRDRILQETGRAPLCFAYPNGRARDFTARTREGLRAHGFELGFTTIPGVNGPETDPYGILRQPTGGNTVGDFAWLVAGR